uniref:Uncharacterized protein n=1 Tax=Arundo donax TaxID=35708 RepID=A0A0A9B0C2_ARUDO
MEPFNLCSSLFSCNSQTFSFLF